MKGTRELFKSILLVTLVLSSVVLTYMNLFNGLMIDDNSSDDVDSSSLNFSQYMSPQSFFISFGGLSYTKVYDLSIQDELWTEVRPYIENCFMNYESVKEITKKEYTEAFTGKSVLIRMPFNLSVDEWLSLYIDKFNINSNLKMTPKEYIINSDKTRSLYIYDASEKKYYHLTNKSLAYDVRPLVLRIKDQGNLEYRTIYSRFSLDSTVEEPFDTLNLELIPVETEFVVPSLIVDNEVSIEDDKFTDEISNISNAVFGSRLDFVKKLRDVNDSIILMYGYGDKSLMITKEGLISYRKKLNPANAKKSSLKEALSLAIGKIENFGIVPEGLYLENYQYDPEHRIHQFKFNYKLNDYAIAYLNANQSPVEITVQDNQVIAIDKNIKIFAGEYSSAKYRNTSLYAVDKCINDNSMEIVVYYLKDNDVREEVLDPTDYYFPLRSEIKSIELSYLETQDNEESIALPIWKVVIDKRTYLFDGYSGDLISSYQ